MRRLSALRLCLGLVSAGGNGCPCLCQRRRLHDNLGARGRHGAFKGRPVVQNGDNIPGGNHIADLEAHLFDPGVASPKREAEGNDVIAGDHPPQCRRPAAGQ